MKARYFLLLLVWCCSPSFAQRKLDTLNFDQFKNIIAKYHPVAQQANLLSDVAKARMAQARGNFDPKLSLNYDQKEYDNINYYRFLTPEVKLPLWYGLELKSSYSEAEGVYLNPENKLPKEGLSFLGINMSLGKGLLIDARRAAIKQAQIFSGASKVEQRRLLNDLMLGAGEAYLNWQNNYKIAKVYEDALALTRVRFEAVKAGLAGGDRPAIDTLEMLTQLQQRQVQLQQAKLNLQNSLLEIGSYLWLADNKPYPLEELNLMPANEEFNFNTDASASIANNPKLISFDFKLKDLQIERRLKAESLRPTVDLQLGVLNGGSNAFRNLNAGYWRNNNKVSFQVAFPLTFQTARGQLAEAKLKIMDTMYDQDLTRNELSVKFNQNQAEAETLKMQLRLINESLQTNEQLLAGEEMKFRFGDSSVFLINARESKLIEVKEKLLETTNKLRKNKLKADWLTGSLAN